MSAYYILIKHFLLQVEFSFNILTILLIVILFVFVAYIIANKHIGLGFFRLKKNYEHLFKENIELKKEIIFKTDKLQTALEKAEESNRLKSLFLANMSHEIRTPLNGIVGFSELIADQEVEQDRKGEFATHIIQSSEQLLKIIDQIFHLSIIEAGKVTVFKEEIDTKKLLQSIRNNFLKKIIQSGKKINFVLSTNDDNETLITDKEKLILIIENLLDNALKFTDRGSIELGFVKFNGDFMFSVSDTGCGIGDDEYDIIFDPFIQGSETLKKIKGGSGLGLSNVKNYIMLLGGKIWCEKNYPHGLIFYFTLPDTGKSLYYGMNDFRILRN